MICTMHIVYLYNVHSIYLYIMPILPIFNQTGSFKYIDLLAVSKPWCIEALLILLRQTVQLVAGQLRHSYNRYIESYIDVLQLPL